VGVTGAGGREQYAGLPVVVAGAGVSGASAAAGLLALGADVTLTDRAPTPRTKELVAAGARFVPDLTAPPTGTAQVVTSPGWRPDSPLLVAAEGSGVEVIGEVELAWRVRDPAVPWLAVTGTNGKTTTVQMLESILQAAGRRAVACGNVGLPTIDVVLAAQPYDVLAVELSSFQLHWTSTLSCAAGALLNIAEDHLEWHDSMAGYVADKVRIWTPTTIAVGNADDLVVAEELSRAASARSVTITLDEPAVGQLGVVDGQLLDRAYGTGELIAAVDVRPAGPHNLANALAAAALALAGAATAADVRAGLRAFTPGEHRNSHIATVDGVAYVDDSKATNPHAALASLSAYDDVVWIAGGLLKNASVQDLVATVADRLAGVVLLGRDRAVIGDAIRRHAPDVPLVEVENGDDGAMAEAVRAAARLAPSGGTVLLAPAAASQDMFTDYAARGRAFAAAVAALGRA